MGKNFTIKVLDTLLLVSILALVILVMPLILAEFQENPENLEEIVLGCNGLNLIEASECVIDNTSLFYQYNLDNVGKNISFEELVSEGGVCSNWSEYYSEVGEGLGFGTENEFIKISDGLYHEFSVWSDESGYCVLDQTEFHCFEFGQ